MDKKAIKQNAIKVLQHVPDRFGFGWKFSLKRKSITPFLPG